MRGFGKMQQARLAAVLAALAVLAAAAPARAGDPLGPLAGSVASQLLPQWQAGTQGDWFVLQNPSADGAEQTLTVMAGPPPETGRHSQVTVSVQGQDSTASVGLLLRNQQARSLCLLEVVADRTARLFCAENGQYREVAAVPGAARLDGSDVIEMVELPGVARFYLNGQPIGDLQGAPALGSEIGIMAYDRGSFGVTGFRIADMGAGAGGGWHSGTGADAPAGAGADAPSGTGGQGDDLARLAGPLADAIRGAAPREGWQLYLQDGWLVLDNEARAGDSLAFTRAEGPPPAAGRATWLNVGMTPAEGWAMKDMPHSAAGILAENRQTGESCVGEVTGAGDGLLLCFDAQGQTHEMGRLPGAARLDGSDVIGLLEAPGVARFVLNGQVLGELTGHPAFGGDLGILAYERGRFHVGSYAVGPLDAAAGGGSPAPAPETVPQSAGSSGFPDFGGDKVRLISVYLGLTNGIFMHEFGHALIGELQIPSTGPEEDAVDIYSALRVVEPTMYPSGDANVDAIGVGVASYAALQWYYSGKMNEQQGAQTPWQDEHTADLKRFRNVFCVMYGGNPQAFGAIAAQIGFDDRTLGRCEEEFAKQNRAWRTILAPHTRVDAWHPEGMLPANAPGAAITVEFQPSSSAVGQFIASSFADSLRGFADDLARTYALPRPMTVVYRDCDQLNAWYSPQDASITMCYNLIEYLAVMVSDIEMGTVNGQPQGGAGGTGGGTGGGGTASPPAIGAAPAAAPMAPSGAMDELADLGVPATSLLFPFPYSGPTPNTHTKARILTTADLAKALNEGTRMLLYDTSGQAQSIPGAMAVPDAGRDGSVTDGFQASLNGWLQQQTGGDTSLPVVFFGAGLQDRSSYNAALRAGVLGWNAYWYRGGTEAWAANGLPLAPPN